MSVGWWFGLVCRSHGGDGGGAFFRRRYGSRDVSDNFSTSISAASASFDCDNIPLLLSLLYTDVDLGRIPWYIRHNSYALLNNRYCIVCTS